MDINKICLNQREKKIIWESILKSFDQGPFRLGLIRDNGFSERGYLGKDPLGIGTVRDRGHFRKEPFGSGPILIEAILFWLRPIWFRDRFDWTLLKIPYLPINK